jgi:hypothetical protein
MPSEFNSARRVSASARRACCVAENWPTPIRARRPTLELTNTICPIDARSAGRRICVSRKGLRTFVDQRRSKSRTRAVSSGPDTCVPLLCTSMSIWPKRSRNERAAARTAASEARSASCTRCGHPAKPLAVRRRRARRRPTNPTAAPLRASAVAIAPPMPPPAPVTSAAQPSRELATSLNPSSCGRGIRIRSQAPFHDALRSARRCRRPREQGRSPERSHPASCRCTPSRRWVLPSPRPDRRGSPYESRC